MASSHVGTVGRVVVSARMPKSVTRRRAPWWLDLWLGDSDQTRSLSCSWPVGRYLLVKTLTKVQKPLQDALILEHTLKCLRSTQAGKRANSTAPQDLHASLLQDGPYLTW
jgi:hypothetical protein